MAFVTRASRAAIVTESTEGTPVAPSAGSNYIGIQEGFALTPSFEEIDNKELRNSIGRSSPILGSENPSVKIDHYIRHSGTEATEPNFGPLIQSALGSKVAAFTEKLTTAGSTAGNASTRATVVLAGGGGAAFQKGHSVLIKDGTNGFNIRPVYSIATDTLSLGFNLTAAPATGLGTGRPILYAPADSSTSLSFWMYRGNAADIELVSGCKVSEMAISAEAGKAMNGSFSLGGIAYYFNPVVIAAADIYLDFLDNAATRAAVITAKTYKDPYDLAQAIQDSMNALGSANTFTCTYSSSTGKYTLTSTGATFTLKWNTGTNTANSVGDKIGFSLAADSSGALTYTSATAYTLTSPQTPAIDAGVPLIVKNNEIYIGDFNDFACASVQSLSMSLKNDLQFVPDLCAESGRAASLKAGREITFDLLFNLTAYDADKFKRFRTGQKTSFLFNAGTKSGGNWDPGKCVSFWAEDCNISSYEVTDTNGIVTIAATMKAYVDTSGNGEFFINFL